MKHRLDSWLCAVAIISAWTANVAFGDAHPHSDPASEWRVYGGHASGDHYSPLTQINKSNVGQLVEAWRFDAGVGDLQTSPLVVDGLLYVVTTDKRVVALEAASCEVSGHYSRLRGCPFGGLP